MQIFNHYYLFTQNSFNVDALELAYKYGYYKPLEERKNEVAKFVTTTSSLIRIHPKGVSGFINTPFRKTEIALAHYDNYQDTIIVISSPVKKTIELFISENNKESSLYLYEMAKTHQLDNEFNAIRELAHEIL